MSQRAPFHEQLRQERERRGWSQSDLAKKVGSDLKTVMRWESGQSHPRPYYQQIFCDLFGKSAEELGLVGREGRHRRHVVSQKDWGEAPVGGKCYGRTREYTELVKWINEQGCRVIAILGIGGVGKTTLTMKVAEQVQAGFEYVFWRSLQNAPPIEHLLKQCTQFLAHQQIGDLPERVEDQILLLLRYMQECRCLLVLDNLESLLQAGGRAGQYRSGYEDYGKLIQRLGEAQHQSCLLLTSREKPAEVALLEGKTTPVRVLQLAGVGQSEGRAILEDKGLVGSQGQWARLIELYSGNPLALKLVAEPIWEVFGGKIGSFLRGKRTAFGDINDLLDQQFQRLSPQEQEVLYWLAIEREAVSLEEVEGDQIRSLQAEGLMEAFDSLRRRFLIEARGSGRFTLQPVIMEYMTGKLVRRAGEGLSGDGVWASYALLKAQTSDYVRESQRRLILDPVAQQLVNRMGRDGIERRVRAILAELRQSQPGQHNYVAGNMLNLLIHLQYDLRGADFSHLAIQQAYLQNTSLPEVNFASARFAGALFTNPFGNVIAVTFSPREEVLATGTASGDIWLYEARSGTPLLTCRGHSDGAWSVAFHPSEQIIASGSDDLTIRLWDTRTGTCYRTLTGHSNRVRSVVFSSDGRLLASGSEDQTIQIWDVGSCARLRMLRGHNDRVWSLSFSPNGYLLASGSTDRTVRLWDIRTGECLKVLAEHGDWVRTVAFSCNGNILASGSDDRTIRLWDIGTGRSLRTLQGHTNRVWSIAFSPDGRTLASGSEDRTVRLWDVETGVCRKMLQEHMHGIRAVAISADGSLLASGGDDQTARLWDVKTGDCLKTLQGYTNRVWSIAFSWDGRMLVSSSEDQRIRLWDPVSGKCRKILQQGTHGARFVAFSPDNALLASGGEDQTVRLWDVQSGDCLKKLRGHTTWVRAVAFSPDGHTIASGGEDQVVRLWDVAGRSEAGCLAILKGHMSWIRSVAFSPDGGLLASGSDDQEIRVWEVKAERCMHILQGHGGRVRAVAFNADGSMLASGSEDRTVRLWDVRTGLCLSMLEGHGDRVRSVVFAPDGRLLASSGDDRIVCLWDVEKGQLLKQLRDHTHCVRSVTFDPGGRVLASGSDDGTIKFWDVWTGECLKTLRNERPYEGMNIANASGLTEVQKETLRALGSIERTLSERL